MIFKVVDCPASKNSRLIDGPVLFLSSYFVVVTILVFQSEKKHRSLKKCPRSFVTFQLFSGNSCQNICRYPISIFQVTNLRLFFVKYIISSFENTIFYKVDVYIFYSRKWWFNTVDFIVVIVSFVVSLSVTLVIGKIEPNELNKK